MKERNLLSLKDLTKKEFLEIIELAEELKKNPKKCVNAMSCKTMLMIFSKPSLRTHLSFDIAMYQLGGHAIYYDLSHSTLGKKESIKDFASVISRYVDVIVARLYSHKDIEEIAKYADVPVINGLTDSYHPCQIVGDFLTIKEHLGSTKKTICYIGDANNNVTHSLIIGASMAGAKIIVCSPNKKEFMPNKETVKGYEFIYEKDPVKAVKIADVIYSDSWMSYQIPESEEKRRVKILKDYQVNDKLFNVNKKALFMHCLPAGRGKEVTDGVIDSARSVVYDQAENRLWSEKAILLKIV